MFSVASSEALLMKGLKELDGFDLVILRTLENGAATCAELARKFQRIYSVIWRRLEKLREAGLVQRAARRGKTGQAFYTACAEKIRALFVLVGCEESPS